MGAAVKLLVLSLIAFVMAFFIRWLCFWDVMPVSWDQEPPRTGALETAFLLLSIQNIAAAAAVIALASGFWSWMARRRGNAKSFSADLGPLNSPQSEREISQ